jgi:enterochelin esterase-like enzyme
MGRLPDSTRFQVVAPERVLPRFGKLAARPLYVYLPAAAAADRRRRFPVIYCQDGQNLWDDPDCCFGHGGWYLNRIADELTAAGKLEPVVLVGIPHSEQRYREYTPDQSYYQIAEHPYANYVCDVVRPYVERQFPVKRGRSRAALLGSSLGGLISLWIAHHYPQLFGNVACLSGAFEPKDRRGKSFLDFLRQRGPQDVRVYLDAGTVRDGAPLTRRVRDLYLRQGWQHGDTLVHWEEQGGEHNERCWRDRVWRALEFLFPAAHR